MASLRLYKYNYYNYSLMKQTESSSVLSIKSVFAVVLSGVVLQTLYTTTTHTPDTESLKLAIQNIRAVNKDMEAMLTESKRKLNIAVDKDLGKYYNDDLFEVFNVVPTDHIIIPDSVAQRFSLMDARDNSYHTANPAASEYKNELYSGYQPGNNYDRQIYVKWSGPKVGYGAFANMDLPVGTFLGDYTGLLVSEMFNTDYMWTYPVVEENDGDTSIMYGVDARHTGNMLRFVNDLTADKLNTEVVFYIRDNIWQVGYRTTKVVRKDEQLFCSYGEGYWKARQMHDPTTDETSSVEN